MSNERFDELLEALLEGDLTPEGVDELEALLRDDESLRREACDRLSEHRLLGLLHQPTDAAATEAILSQVAVHEKRQVDGILELTSGGRASGDRAASPTAHRWPWWITVGVAGTLTILTVLSLVFDRNGSEEIRMSGEGASRSPEPAIATMLLCESCEWAGGVRLDEGQRVAPGPLELTSGFAFLRFDGGAEVVLQGEVSIQLLSPGSARLERGNVVIRAPEEAAGFSLMTPASELLDLGTEFSVRVDPSGVTELDVLEGEVSVRPLEMSREESRVLRAGHAVVVDSARSEPRDIEVKSKRFAALVKDVNPSSSWELTYAYEGFFYDEGRVPLDRSVRGKGWVGPWRARTVAEGYSEEQDLTDFLEIVHGRMNVTWPVDEGRLGMLRMPPGKTVRIRQMRRSIRLSENGTYYLSFMLRVHEPAERRRHDDFRVTFRSTADYFGESLSFGVPRGTGPRIRTGVGVGCRGRSSIPGDQSMICVAKIDARRVGADRARFRVFAESDEIECLEPREWDVDCRDLDLSAELDLAIITSVGDRERIVDELRVGPTWRSVVPVLGVVDEETKRDPRD